MMPDCGAAKRRKGLSFANSSCRRGNPPSGPGDGHQCLGRRPGQAIGHHQGIQASHLQALGASPRPHRPTCGDGGKKKHMGLGRIGLDQEVEVHQFALKKEAAKVQGQGRPKSVGKPRQSWPIGATSPVEGQPYQQFCPDSAVQMGGKLAAMLPNQFIDREAKQALLESQSLHLEFTPDHDGLLIGHG